MGLTLSPPTSRHRHLHPRVQHRCGSLCGIKWHWDCWDGNAVLESHPCALWREVVLLSWSSSYLQDLAVWTGSICCKATHLGFASLKPENIFLNLCFSPFKKHSRKRGRLKWSFFCLIASNHRLFPSSLTWHKVTASQNPFKKRMRVCTVGVPPCFWKYWALGSQEGSGWSWWGELLTVQEGNTLEARRAVSDLSLCLGFLCSMDPMGIFCASVFSERDFADFSMPIIVKGIRASLGWVSKLS